MPRHPVHAATFPQVRQGIDVVELRGFEPLTFSLRTRRATNCATAPLPTGRTRSEQKTYHPADVAPESALPWARVSGADRTLLRAGVCLGRCGCLLDQPTVLLGAPGRPGTRGPEVDGADGARDAGLADVGGQGDRQRVPQRLAVRGAHRHR